MIKVSAQRSYMRRSTLIKAAGTESPVVRGAAAAYPGLATAAWNLTHTAKPQPSGVPRIDFSYRGLSPWKRAWRGMNAAFGFYR